jgi:hypothetical protein
LVKLSFRSLSYVFLRILTFLLFVLVPWMWKPNTSLSDCGTSQLSEYRTVRLTGCRIIATLPSWNGVWLNDCWCINATFSNIPAISWRPPLVVEEAEYPERTTDHGQVTSKLYHSRLRFECTLFYNVKSRVRTHTVLVIGLYELLDNPIEAPRTWPMFVIMNKQLHT